MLLSKHAELRMQQRAIPMEVLDILDAFGIEFNQKGGTLIQTVHREEAQAIIKKLKKACRFMEKLDRYFCVLSEQDLLITTGHHFKQLRRNS